MTVFIAMYHPGLPGEPQVLAPEEAEDAYAAKGWLVVDGNTPAPEPIYLTPGVGDLRYLKLSDPGDPNSTGGAALRAAFDTVLTPDGSSDQTGRINAALATANPFGVRRRVTLVGDFTTSAPIVIPSRTVLDARQATITLATGSKCHILANAAVTAGRTVRDFTTTAASTALTSTTAAFTGADVGQPISINGAGSSGERLDTTIASVADGSTATLAAAATVAGTFGGSIGPRDSDIRVVGGSWVRAAGNGVPGGADDGNQLHSLFFRRVDGLVVEGYSFTSSDGKYGVAVADVTDYVVQDGVYDSASDGVHVDGLSYRGRISRITGTNGDDLVGITGNPGSLYTQYADSVGDVIDLLVEDCTITAETSNGYACSVVGDPDTTTYITKGITIRRCGDVFNLARRSVHISNGTTDVTVDRCFGAVTITTLNGGSTSRAHTGLRILGHRLDYTDGAPTQAVNVTDTTVADLTIDGVLIAGVPAASAVYPVVIGPGSTVDSLVLRNLTKDDNSGSLVYIYGTGTTVQSCVIDGCSRDGQDYSTGRIITCDTDAAVSHIRIANTDARRCQWPVNIAMTGICYLYVTGSRMEGVQDLRAVTVNMKVQAAGNLWSGNGVALSGGTVASQGDLMADVSTLVKTAGDSAYNTNAAVAGGVGPVVTDGTVWRNLATGVAA